MTTLPPDLSRRELLQRALDDHARLRGASSPLQLMALHMQATPVDEVAALDAMAVQGAAVGDGWLECAGSLRRHAQGERLAASGPPLAAEWVIGPDASAHLRRIGAMQLVMTTFTDAAPDAAPEKQLCLADWRRWMSTDDKLWLRYRVYWQPLANDGALRLVAARFAGFDRT